MKILFIKETNAKKKSSEESNTFGNNSKTYKISEVKSIGVDIIINNIILYHFN